MPAPISNNCLRYRDLADHIQLPDAIALWCGVEPVELAELKYETRCMSAKRAALVTVLRDGRLEYEDLGIVTARGQVFKGAPIKVRVQKMLRLARLAPEVVEDIAKGQQAVGVSLEFFMRNPMPDDWNAQRDVIGEMAA